MKCPDSASPGWGAYRHMFAANGPGHFMCFGSASFCQGAELPHVRLDSTASAMCRALAQLPGSDATLPPSPPHSHISGSGRVVAPPPLLTKEANSVLKDGPQLAHDRANLLLCGDEALQTDVATGAVPFLARGELHTHMPATAYIGPAPRQRTGKATGQHRA